jgi:acetoin utilization deacetylase AcuC-like enzyme
MSLPIVYHPDYVVPLPPAHRFPMAKFGRLYEVLIGDGIATLDQFHRPEPAARALIEQTHEMNYVGAYYEGKLDAKAQRRIGLPWSEALVKRTCTAVGGTLLTAQLALEHGVACNTAGGTHHAFFDYGSGYCIFNDLAVTASALQKMGLVQKILIVDLDVHQGDGTAAIFQNDPTVFTFSIHCQANFPFKKQRSDLDVPLPEGADDTTYLEALTTYLPDLLASFKPDLVLYDAGVDPHQTDRLGKLSLTDAGLYRRDWQVLQACLSRGYPVATVVGGGYAEDITALARRHALLYRAATELYQRL